MKNLGISTCYTVTIYIHYINYTLSTFVSEFTDSLRQMKPVFLLSFLKHINVLSQLFTLHFHIVHPIPFNLIYTLLGLSFRLTKLSAVKLYTMIFCAYRALQFLQLVNRKGKLWLRIRMRKSNFIIGQS